MYTCHFWSNSPFFSLLRLASSACKSLQCLISALTRGGESGLLFGLTCSVVLWIGTVQTNTASMCGKCSHWVDLRRVATIQGSVHFPDPSYSGSQGCCEGTVLGGLYISSAKLVSGCDAPGQKRRKNPPNRQFLTIWGILAQKMGFEPMRRFHHVLLP